MSGQRARRSGAMVQRRMATFKTLVGLCVASAGVLSLLLFALLHSDDTDGGPGSGRIVSHVMITTTSL